MTLDGNFSKTFGRSVSLRRGRVPVLVIGNGSEQPKFTNKSTNDFVASIELSLSADSLAFGVSCVKWVDASENAAFAYDKQVRPSWSTCCRLAWFWILKKKRMIEMNHQNCHLPNSIMNLYPYQNLHNRQIAHSWCQMKSSPQITFAYSWIHISNITM